MSKRIVPFGDRIVCKRRVVGHKIGSGLLFASDKTAATPTDLADVIYTSDLTMVDKVLLENSEQIVSSLAEGAKSGDVESLEALEKFRLYLQHKTIQPGDLIVVNKYCGCDFLSKESNSSWTVVRIEDVMGRIEDKEAVNLDPPKEILQDAPETIQVVAQ